MSVNKSEVGFNNGGGYFQFAGHLIFSKFKIKIKMAFLLVFSIAWALFCLAARYRKA